MDDDSFSCIKEITKNVTIILSTAFQGNEISGISNILDSWKRQYIQQLQGIVVSYRNVSLVTKFAYIKSDYPVIHCNVQATFELFIPTVGSIIKGKVNRISHDYIGCLVHNSINVAIDRSRNEYDSVSQFIALDQVILFEITHIGFKRKIIRVKGKITRECINLMKNMNLSIVETGATDLNLLPSLSHSSEDDTAGEEHVNYGTDLRNEIQSQSLLYDNSELFDGNLNDINFIASKRKKKKSSKFQTEQNHNRSCNTTDMESGEVSPSLLSNNFSLNVNDSSDVSLDSPKKKKEKSNKLQTEVSTDRQFEPIGTKKKDGSLSLLSTESAGLFVENSVGDSYSPRRTKIKSNKKLRTEERTEELSISFPTETIIASNCNSHKKKKSKRTSDNSPGKILTAHIMEENLTDTSSQLSLSSKKKKRKRSKADRISSPSLFSDSLSSSKDDNIEPFKVPRSPSKKKRKLSQDNNLASEMTPNLKDFVTPLHDNNNIISDSYSTSLPLQKACIKTEDFDNVVDFLSSFNPSLGNHSNNETLPKDVNNKSLDSTKKPKKRKHESPDKDGLPKKKKKLEKETGISVKSSSKHKTNELKKKRKKSKDSKKDKKKKSKKRVISSKKKLPKLKKKKKGKDEKLKKKKSKGTSKHKQNNVP